MKYEDAVEFIRRWGVQWVFNSGKKVQCGYAPWLCVLPYLMRISEDTITWADSGQIKVVTMWMKLRSGKLLLTILICLLPKSLPFTKRRLWKLESRSEIWSFNLEYAIPIDKVSISDVMLLREIFLCNNPKSCVLLTFQLELRKLFVKVKGTVSQQSSSFCLVLPITRPQSLWNLK